MLKTVNLYSMKIKLNLLTRWRSFIDWIRKIQENNPNELEKYTIEDLKKEIKPQSRQES